MFPPELRPPPPARYEPDAQAIFQLEPEPPHTATDVSNGSNPQGTRQMARTTTSTAIRIVNFTAGFALLVMLTPHHGQLPQKPAGVRTAIELVSKKIAIRAAHDAAG